MSGNTENRCQLVIRNAAGMPAIGSQWLLAPDVKEDLFTLIRFGDLLRDDGDHGLIEVIG
jgi:hypothetical protein